MAGMAEDCSRDTFVANIKALDLMSHKVTRTVAHTSNPMVFNTQRTRCVTSRLSIGRTTPRRKTYNSLEPAGPDLMLLI